MTSSAAAPTGNRWAIAFAGVIVMIMLGTTYAWSNFTTPLRAAFGWDAKSTSLIFGIAIFSLGIGALVGGRWQDRSGPRNVTIAGAVLWGVGNILAAIGPHQIWWWDLTYGVIGGFGLGMGYITPVATVTKWFPDKRGLASGMVVMGFGLGALFYGFILKAIGSFADASKAAATYMDAKTAAAAAAAGTAAATAAPAVPPVPLTPDQVGAITTVFLVSGIVYAVVGGLCATLLRNPPAGYTVASATAAATSSDAHSFTPAQAIRTPAMWLLWLMLFLNVTAGILVVSNAVPIIRELISKGVTDPAQIKALAGAAISAYAFVAIFNALGRFFWGAVSDRLGRNMAYALIYACQVVVFFLLPNFHTIPLVLISFAIILACYGGGFGTMPSFNADFFGTKYLGQNYGVILTAWGVGGLVGPFIAGSVKDATGSYSGSLIPMAVMLLFAIVLPFITKKPVAPVKTTSTARVGATV
ncbi:oxalate:formate antiporter [Vulcanimicrobium alpinum]|uniref:Oxalate:formate antiporter n=1 Tax=Vulcanimicrobium alpinum TaxID=3016050 RepID=A0AAN2C7V8_UNVUL|nr:OFA family MFS transporter [Vulcanimicrobium alpinum]BDE04859.1 oxalate:formate antiporter [Vulcanimicrobium alpinum]